MWILGLAVLGYVVWTANSIVTLQAEVKRLRLGAGMGPISDAEFERMNQLPD